MIGDIGLRSVKTPRCRRWMSWEESMFNFAAGRWGGVRAEDEVVNYGDGGYLDVGETLYLEPGITAIEGRVIVDAGFLRELKQVESRSDGRLFVQPGLTPILWICAAQTAGSLNYSSSNGTESVIFVWIKSTQMIISSRTWTASGFSFLFSFLSLLSPISKTQNLTILFHQSCDRGDIFMKVLRWIFYLDTSSICSSP